MAYFGQPEISRRPLHYYVDMANSLSKKAYRSELQGSGVALHTSGSPKLLDESQNPGSIEYGRVFANGGHPASDTPLHEETGLVNQRTYCIHLTAPGLNASLICRGADVWHVPTSMRSGPCLSRNISSKTLLQLDAYMAHATLDIHSTQLCCGCIFLCTIFVGMPAKHRPAHCSAS